jgi:hypothetical protein
MWALALCLCTSLLIFTSVDTSPPPADNGEWAGSAPLVIFKMARSGSTWLCNEINENGIWTSCSPEVERNACMEYHANKNKKRAAEILFQELDEILRLNSSKKGAFTITPGKIVDFLDKPGLDRFYAKLSAQPIHVLVWQRLNAVQSAISFIIASDSKQFHQSVEQAQERKKVDPHRIMYEAGIHIKVNEDLMQNSTWVMNPTTFLQLTTEEGLTAGGGVDLALPPRFYTNYHVLPPPPKPENNTKVDNPHSAHDCALNELSNAAEVLSYFRAGTGIHPDRRQRYWDELTLHCNISEFEIA